MILTSLNEPAINAIKSIDRNETKIIKKQYKQIKIYNKKQIMIEQLFLLNHDYKEFFLKILIKNKNIFSKYFKKNIIIHKILKINLTKSNNFINITDYMGKTIYHNNYEFDDSLNNKHDSKKSIIKNIIAKNKTNNLTIHFIKKDKNLNKNMIKNIKHFTRIKEFKLFFLNPHNGCRPKKIKRLKKFNINF